MTWRWIEISNARKSTFSSTVTDECIEDSDGKRESESFTQSLRPSFQRLYVNMATSFKISIFARRQDEAFTPAKRLEKSSFFDTS